ncbi:hypothetical protein LAZ67_17002171 [Cordylochernes scorpioides]|uniref:Uncharacterized protein n=1 Tax=Cordylochernes scorpioides TaxID=51811 RepID=A0ABY6LHJ6_9ARAC|nr:hypothetical protein LAZ67_17002171 [Cordylochernes scorpioides]
MKGRRYATLDEIKTASKEKLKKILKNNFLKCFEDWKNRWHKCIISHGDYFEGDKIAPVLENTDKIPICIQWFKAMDLISTGLASISEHPMGEVMESVKFTRQVFKLVKWQELIFRQDYNIKLRKDDINVPKEASLSYTLIYGSNGRLSRQN